MVIQMPIKNSENTPAFSVRTRGRFFTQLRIQTFTPHLDNASASYSGTMQPNDTLDLPFVIPLNTRTLKNATCLSLAIFLSTSSWR